MGSNLQTANLDVPEYTMSVPVICGDCALYACLSQENIYGYFAEAFSNTIFHLILIQTFLINPNENFMTLWIKRICLQRLLRLVLD